MRQRTIPVLTCAVLGLLPAWVGAQVISVNFSGGPSGGPGAFPLAAGDMAGNPNYPGSFTSTWNDAPGSAGTNLALVTNANAPTALLLSYTTGLGTWSLPDTTTGTNLSGGANPQMMRGYLDAAGAAQPASVTLSGLGSFSKAYRIAIFFDGDNGGDWRVGTYTIRNTADSAQLWQGGGEDSEGVNFNAGPGNSDNENPNGLFQVPVGGGSGNQVWPVSPNNNEGNFLVSDWLTADGITLEAIGSAAGSGTLRAPINGIQILVPEPMTLGLLAVGAAGLLARRRRAV